MLVLTPDVIHPGTPKAFSPEAVLVAGRDSIGLGYCEEIGYQFPV